MKRSIKKAISILLCAVMLSGVFSVLPITAGAEVTATDDKPLLLGDVDGDGEVAVLDADLIVEGENPYANFYDLSLLSEKMNAYYNAG